MHKEFARCFGDPELLQAIVNTCVAHGLTLSEICHSSTYPDRCDIKGQKVNLLFLAILLRIGDLLDMRYERACPLLLSAASPLPPDSYAQWTKYHAIKRHLTAHDKIEVIAECDTQDEHRFLQDWCQWLDNEIHEATIIMVMLLGITTGSLRIYL